MWRIHLINFLFLFSRVFCQYGAVVIGSGIGGLAAASTLSEYKEVLLLEKSFKFGGSIQTFSRIVNSKEYTFDVGLHVVGNNEGNIALFNNITKEPVKWEPVGDILHRLIVGDKEYTLKNNGESGWFNDLVDYFPAEEKAIRAIEDKLKNLKDMDLQLMEYLDSVTDNEALKSVLVHMTLYIDLHLGMPLWRFGELMKYFNNGLYYPHGSSQKIINSTLEKIVSNGGTIMASNGAKSLVMNEISPKVVAVEDEKGDYHYTTRVAASPSILEIFNPDMIDHNVLEALGYDAKVKQCQPSFSAFMMWLGISGDCEAVGLEKAIVFKLKETYYSGLEKYLAAPNPQIDNIPMLFLSSNSVKDPLYPKGQSALSVIVPVAYKWFQQWENTTVGKRPPEYYALKARFVDAVMEQVTEIYPKIHGSIIDVTVSASPLTLDWFLGHRKGAIYGCERNDVDKVAWIDTPTLIEGLFLAGQDVDGGGTEGSIWAGINATLNILGEGD